MENMWKLKIDTYHWMMKTKHQDKQFQKISLWLMEICFELLIKISTYVNCHNYAVIDYLLVSCARFYNRYSALLFDSCKFMLKLIKWKSNLFFKDWKIFKYSGLFVVCQLPLRMTSWFDVGTPNNIKHPHKYWRVWTTVCVLIIHFSLTCVLKSEE